jgi:hypothetical protein
MDQYDCAVLWQRDIRSAGKIPPMQPEPHSARMKIPAHGKFGLRIASANPGHHSGPRLAIDNICHVRSLPSADSFRPSAFYSAGALRMAIQSVGKVINRFVQPIIARS